MTTKNESDSFSFESWFKSATQYSIMLLIIFVMFYILMVSSKNKININFSKKENKRILIGMILVLIYIYRDHMSIWFDEIKKDALEPGTGYFGKMFNNIKDKMSFITTLCGKPSSKVSIKMKL